jgi:hypothetical protein
VVFASYLCCGHVAFQHPIFNKPVGLDSAIEASIGH